MDGQNLFVSNGTTLVDGLTNDIDDSTESLGTDGNLNGVASVEDGLTTDETLSGVKSNGTHVVSTQMLGNFENKTVLDALDFEGVENGREFAFELNIDDSTNNLGNFTVSGGESTYYIQQSQSL